MLRSVIQHFLPELTGWFEDLPDPRVPERCSYAVSRLLWTELMMLLGGVGSRHAMQGESHDRQFATTLGQLCGDRASEPTAPHPDTPYVYLQTLPPAALAELFVVLFKDFLRQRCFDDFRYHGQWLIAVDATWVRTFKQPHCPECLRQRQADGSLLYMHAVIEAKVILSNGMVLPLLSLAIQNDDPFASKQDCERKAFVRLAAKLKHEFPKLPICLLMDALYCCGPVLKQCADHQWSYIIVCKEGNTPKLYREAKAAAQLGRAQTWIRDDGTRQVFRWATNLSFSGQSPHVVFCDESHDDGQPPTQWAWISDQRPDLKWAPIIANDGGRQRWQLEENFNALKHGAVTQRHNFGSKQYAWHNTWLLAQLADLMLQLITHSDAIRTDSRSVYTRFQQAYGSIREFVCRLRESFRRDAEKLAEQGSASPGRCQMRFNTS